MANHPGDHIYFLATNDFYLSGLYDKWQSHPRPARQGCCQSIAKNKRAARNEYRDVALMDIPPRPFQANHLYSQFFQHSKKHLYHISPCKEKSIYLEYWDHPRFLLHPLYIEKHTKAHRDDCLWQDRRSFASSAR